MTETPQSEPILISLADAITAVQDACRRADVDDYNGEAVFFLDALLLLSTGEAKTPDEAVATSYGATVPEAA